MRLLKLLSIRSLLVLLMLLSALPLLTLVVWTNRNAERQALKLLSRNAVEMAQSFTVYQQLVDTFLVSMLDSFSSELSLRNPRSADVSAFFKREAGGMEMLEDVLLMDASGDVLASLNGRFDGGLKDFRLPDGIPPGVPYIGNALFREEADGKKTACLPCIRFFETESTRYAVVMLLKIAYLENLAKQLQYPEDWSLRVLDVSGHPLLRHLSGDSTPAGEEAFSSVWAHIRSGEESGFFVASDDAEHVFGYSRVHLTPNSSPYAITVVSVPTKSAVRTENIFILRTLLLTVALMLMGLLLALGVGRTLLLAPIDRLVEAHRRFARGDLTSRAGIQNGIREMQLLSKAFDEMASVLEIQDLRRRSETEEIKEQAHRDYLTGTWNRRAGLLALERLMSEAREHGMLLAIFFIDIDFFKLINDEYGHNEGDKMLRRVTLLLERHLRARDSLCRYGGDEFLVILPGCTWEAAEDVWRRIEKEIRRIDDSGGIPYVFSLSHGLAIFDPLSPLPLAPEQLIAEADARMYEEKAKHRTDR